MLSRAEYLALDTALRATPESWEGRVGIEMWVALGDDRYTSEKAAGYPVLQAPLETLGLARLGPLLYGGLACLGLWALGGRWLGRPGAAAAVAGFCLSGGSLLMAHRHYMPTFTAGALLTAGACAAGWALLAEDAPRRRRGLWGCVGLLLIGLAMLTRLTFLPALLLTLGVLVHTLRWPRWWMAWGGTAIALIGVQLLSNHLIFGHPLRQGYQLSHSMTSLSIDAIPNNIRTLAGRLLLVLPLYPLAMLAAWRRRHEPVTRVLLGCWGSVWGVHLMHAWISTQGARLHPILTTRFFIAAAGPVALLAADWLQRQNRLRAAVVLTGVAVAGGLLYWNSLQTDWVFVDGNLPPRGRTIPSVQYQPR